MTDQNTEKQKPIATHRDGRVSAAIWQNPGEHGPIYNATLSYSYQNKEGQWLDTHSIPGHELLKAGRLAEEAYGTIHKLKKRDRDQYVQQEQSQAAPGPVQAHPREH
ncbi:MAG: hypothetical protein AAGG56_05570 [Pseudomonadota bacterium]